jgi:hypothetical protein
VVINCSNELRQISRNEFDGQMRTDCVSLSADTLRLEECSRILNFDRRVVHILRKRVRDSTPTDKSHVTVKEIEKEREEENTPLTPSTVIAIYTTRFNI